LIAASQTDIDQWMPVFEGGCRVCHFHSKKHQLFRGFATFSQRFNRNGI
jgi:hypothetical protein